MSKKLPALYGTQGSSQCLKESAIFPNSSHINSAHTIASLSYKLHFGITSDAVTNSLLHYCHISDLLQCKEIIHTREINGFHLKTVIFKWWWWWWWWQQLIFHSAQNVRMHQLTNCTFPYIRYLICKNMQFLSHSVLEIQSRNLMPRNQLIWAWVFMGFLTAGHNQSAFICHVN